MIIKKKPGLTSVPSREEVNKPFPNPFANEDLDIRLNTRGIQSRTPKITNRALFIIRMRDRFFK